MSSQWLAHSMTLNGRKFTQAVELAKAIYAMIDAVVQKGYDRETMVTALAAVQALYLTENFDSPEARTEMAEAIRVDTLKQVDALIRSKDQRTRLAPTLPSTRRKT